MTTTYQSDTTLRDVYRALFRHRGKAFLFFITVMTATVLATILMPRAYLAENLSPARDDTPDHGVGLNGPLPARRQRQRPLHVPVIQFHPILPVAAKPRVEGYWSWQPLSTPPELPGCCDGDSPISSVSTAVHRTKEMERLQVKQINDRLFPGRDGKKELIRNSQDAELKSIR